MSLVALKMRKSLMSLALAGAVAACGGGDVADKFDGDRISVLSFDTQVQADPRLKNAEIPVLPAFRNASWANPGGFPTHASYHLELDGLGRSAFTLMQLREIAAPLKSKRRRLSLTAKFLRWGLICKLAAFDAKTGSTIWTQSLIGGIYRAEFQSDAVFRS